MSIRYSVDPDKATATATDKHGKVIAKILYETSGPYDLHVRWAESSVPGTATALLKKIVQVEETDFIRMTPTTWSGAGWVRKLVREHRRGLLPLVAWDFYGDQYEVTWTDGRKPSEDDIDKFIKSGTDSDIRRNPTKPRVASSGLVVIEFFDNAFWVMTPEGTVQPFSTARAAAAHAKKWGKTHMQADAINVLRIDWRGRAAELARKAGVLEKG